MNEALRFGRVCFELGTRATNERRESSLAYLESALLPGCSSFAAEAGADAEYLAWQESVLAELHKGKAYIERLIADRAVEREGRPNDEVARSEFSRTLVQSLLRMADLLSILYSRQKLVEMQQDWNLQITVWMEQAQRAVGRTKEAETLRSECLEVVMYNDDIWSRVAETIKRDQREIALMPRTSGREEFSALRTLLNEALESKLEPVLTAVKQTLQTGYAVQDRLDLVVERLIDLNERSKLTWAAVREKAREEPDYREQRDRISRKLGETLSATWRELRSQSQTDLVDAEFVFEQCKKVDAGWRMAIMGYAVVLERELRASYPSITERLLGTPGTNVPKKLGDFIDALRKSAARFKNHTDPSLRALFDSLDLIAEINDRRNAAHASGEIDARDRRVGQKAHSGRREVAVICMRARTIQRLSSRSRTATSTPARPIRSSQSGSTSSPARASSPTTSTSRTCKTSSSSCRRCLGRPCGRLTGPSAPGRRS